MDSTTNQVDAIRDRLPDSARDLRLNLGTVLSEQGAPGLTANQRWGSAISAAITARQPELTEAIVAEAKAQGTDDATVDAARSAAAIMGMNNIYYRFVHLVGDAEYRGMPARLRMNVIGKPGVPAEDFELYSLVASAINGCGACMENHEKELRKRGLSREGIQSGVRIGAVIHGAAIAL
ncbi:MAG: carboxymuconolactone decarboxylase family protein [Gammaproteobacteria bacterium]